MAGVTQLLLVALVQPSGAIEVQPVFFLRMLETLRRPGLFCHFIPQQQQQQLCSKFSFPQDGTSCTGISFLPEMVGPAH